MTEKLKQTIKEEVGKLPKENQDVINNFGWEKISEEIGKKFLLTESEINDLQVETLLILIGLQDPDEYAQNVENNIGTSKAEAEKIADEVLQKIFTPINDILIENIKKSGVIKDTNTEQNLNFILSGGDYSVFVTEKAPPLNEEKKNTPIITPSLADIKANMQKTTPPPKMTDIKNKFTI
ncbi:MAG: hypothetical protein ABIG99_02325 [Patescibacteria group bacterium]